MLDSRQLMERPLTLNKYTGSRLKIKTEYKHMYHNQTLI